MDVLPSEVHNALIAMINARDEELRAHAALKGVEQRYDAAVSKRKHTELELCRQMRSERMKGVTRIVRKGTIYEITNGGLGPAYDRIIIESVAVIE